MAGYSRKQRREARREDDISPPAPGDENPWLADMATDREPTADQAAQYSAWAERMSEKRIAVQADINGEANEPAATYWTTDNLYRESERVEAEEVASRPNPSQVRELLAVLDLREGASRTEVGGAYKRLAKIHHPDRYVEADDETRELHLDRMRAINAAYRTLRTLHGT